MTFATAKRPRHCSGRCGRPGAFGVVDHRNQAIAAAPGASRRGLFPKIRARRSPAAPGFNIQSKTATSPPSTRRRRGERTSALRAVWRSVPADAGNVSMTPRRMGGECGATPRLAAAGCAEGCCPRRWRFVACTSRRTVHRHTRPAGLMELPSHASSTRPQAAAGALPPCRWGIGLAASGHKPVKPSRVDVESVMSPFGSGRPVRPWFVVNPGEGTAAPLASWPQPSSTNNFPAAARLPRGTNSLRFQVLHAVATAARCGQPSPRRPDHNKDALARSCSTRKENHHG